MYDTRRLGPYLVRCGPSPTSASACHGPSPLKRAPEALGFHLSRGRASAVHPPASRRRVVSPLLPLAPWFPGPLGIPGSPRRALVRDCRHKRQLHQVVAYICDLQPISPACRPSEWLAVSSWLWLLGDAVAATSTRTCGQRQDTFCVTEDNTGCHNSLIGLKPISASPMAAPETLRVPPPLLPGGSLQNWRQLTRLDSRVLQPSLHAASGANPRILRVSQFANLASVVSCPEVGNRLPHVLLAVPTCGGPEDSRQACGRGGRVWPLATAGPGG